MRRYARFIVIPLMLIFLAGCNKEITQTDFMEFAEECRAQEYYQICNELVADESTSYYYNHDNGIIFDTYTMLEKCRLDNDAFESVRDQINEEFNVSEIVSGYVINDVAYDIYYVEDENRFYGEYQEFGFIAFNEENGYIDFYWFYDQDYDPVIDDADSFDEFFKENFKWLEV